MGEEYKEFRDSIKKVNGPRVHKLNNSIGSYDLYKHIRKNKWYNIERPVTEKEFYAITRKVNNELGTLLSIGLDIVLPHRMGTLELRKYKLMPRIKDGKIVVPKLIDWDSTLKLWYEDEEAFNNKTLVKVTEKENFSVCYNKSTAAYNNKGFYHFKPNRDLKNKIKQNVKEGIVDSFLKCYG